MYVYTLRVMWYSQGRGRLSLWKNPVSASDSNNSTHPPTLPVFWENPGRWHSGKGTCRNIYGFRQHSPWWNFPSGTLATCAMGKCATITHTCTCTLRIHEYIVLLLLGYVYIKIHSHGHSSKMKQVFIRKSKMFLFCSILRTNAIPRKIMGILVSQKYWSRWSRKSATGV